MRPEQIPTAVQALARMWLECPLPRVLDHILRTYHEPLRVDLARMRQLIQQALDASADEHRAVLQVMGRHFATLCDELNHHMDKEEQILFPWIRIGRGASARAPMRVMQYEHQHTEEVLAKLRTLSEQYGTDAPTDPVAQSIVLGLAALDRFLQEHSQFEELVFHRVLNT
jgi:regulator of cell morphogenesis and NO signaling